MIDGYTVAGKTGTAQIPECGPPGLRARAYVGSFAGFAPAQDPVLSAIVVLNHPTPDLRWCRGRSRLLHHHGVRPSPLRHPHHRRSHHWQHPTRPLGRQRAVVTAPPGSGSRKALGARPASRPIALATFPPADDCDGRPTLDGVIVPNAGETRRPPRWRGDSTVDARQPLYCDPVRQHRTATAMPARKGCTGATYCVERRLDDVTRLVVAPR